jgi:hypothetical protein
MIRHKLFVAACTMLLAGSTLSQKAEAQDNTIYTTVLSNIAYNPKDAAKDTKSTLLSIGKTLITGEASTQLDEYADDVRAAVVKGLSDVRRLRVIDADVATDFYIDGTITNITTTSKLITPTDTKKSPYTGYKAQIRVTINLKNCNDGTVENSQSFSITESNMYSWLTTKETAISEALSTLADDIDTYYEHLFPLSAQMEEVGDAKKDKQKELYINIGSSLGVYKNEEFYAYTVSQIGTKEARKEVGRVKVTEVMGDEISLCKVTKGGDKIKAAIDANTPLVFVSK